MNEERGPIYGVKLIDTLPIAGGMLQQMPSREDLEQSRTYGDRVAASYEVLLSHYYDQLRQVAELEAERAKDRAAMLELLREWDDWQTYGPGFGHASEDHYSLVGTVKRLRKRLGIEVSE